MLDLGITIDNLPPFIGRMKTGARVIRDELVVAGTAITKKGQSDSAQYAPVWKGVAKGSIFGRTEVDVSSISAVWGSTAKHAYWADQGRGPGKMPPKGALVGWHGITPENEFPVRRAIGRRGTKGTPFVTRSFKEIVASGFAVSEYAKGLARAMKRLGGP